MSVVKLYKTNQESDTPEVSKENYVVNYLKSMLAIEEAIEPYKEQKRDLRSSYNENNWLTRDEMRMAVKAWRLMKTDTDFEELTDIFNQVRKGFRGV